MGLQLLYCGKFDPKREVHTLKGTMTLTDYKSLFIYTHLYLQALMQVPSVTIQWNSAEWMHSCRNLWGIKKYSISYHTIPYHLTLYHIIRCVWGPFTKYEKHFYRLQYLSIGLHLLWTGSSDFCCHFKLQVEAIG